MCGTILQIGGMAVALYFTDMLITPVIRTRSEISDIFMFLIKGAVEFGVYRYFKCKPDGTFARHPFRGLSFMEIILGGLIGGVTLFFTGQMVGEKKADDFIQVLLRYGVEAVVLNFVYGATNRVITDMVPPAK